MNEVIPLLIPILDKIAFLAFVVATMFGTGLKLTVQQIWQPLRNIRLVVLSLFANFVLVPLFVYLLLQAIPGTKMALRPAASLVLVLADFIVGCTDGTTAMTAHNVA